MLKVEKPTGSFALAALGLVRREDVRVALALLGQELGRVDNVRIAAGGAFRLHHVRRKLDHVFVLCAVLLCKKTRLGSILKETIMLRLTQSFSQELVLPAAVILVDKVGIFHILAATKTTQVSTLP